MDDTSRPSICAKEISKVYKMSKDNVVTALKKASFEIQAGDFVAIVGPSGSGKSTLLHLIGLLDKPDTGEIVIDDHNISDLGKSGLAKLRRQKIGFVFQMFNLLPRITVYKNVMLPLIYAKHKRKERSTRVKELLRDVGLSDRSGHQPNQLSGGEKQRVAIARALANKPKIILADEPTGNLDSKSGEKIMKLLWELNQQGVTVIVVTHDYKIASKASTTFRMLDGEVAETIQNHVKDIEKIL